MNLPGLTCCPYDLYPQPNNILRKLYGVLVLFCNCFLLFFHSYCYCFYWEIGPSTLKLSSLHRLLLSFTSAISFQEWQVLAAVQNLVYNFHYPHYSSLKLFQLFCTPLRWKDLNGTHSIRCIRASHRLTQQHGYAFSFTLHSFPRNTQHWLDLLFFLWN